MLFTVLVSIAFNFTFGSMRDGAVYTTVRNSFNFSPEVMNTMLAMLALTVVFKKVRQVTGIDDIVIPMVTLKCITLTSKVMLFGVARLPTIVGLVMDDTFK